ncbi:hypothetical protein AMS68_002305 [Peltaster fructicola]|uniref:tRNA (adenine(58)-N(1))-methyltransferase catalytic subunit TRM61 n=1 Tax=Peltaster fructicola TaxID=286661 RepID=A0A6H0XQ72_9PEZI|nr:hypothetical protein AMS68_002305 [Peltaster fructicola]
MARSSFLYTPATAADGSLAILHLQRDTLQPVQLKSTADDGYAEGAVINTRFGSYPHSTLIGAPWGSQIRASKVDTGTRGRRGQHALSTVDNAQQSTTTAETASLKRKPDTLNGIDEPTLKKQKLGAVDGMKPPVEAGSGFTHLLQPTPESWTSSLDHRTQVVYVPDYSYILSRLAVKPGDALIEAGAGSGSFTHAAARAVYNGYPSAGESKGKVYSFEYHEPRVQTLRHELQGHGLESIVELTHRDVCGEGFAVPMTSNADVTAIFLDLPAPWDALKHLARDAPNSPLSRDGPVHICTFSPCIEQVSLAVSALRSAGWTDITMVEVANRRLEVRRERTGFKEEGLRGVHAVASSVDESLQRLRDVEFKLKQFQGSAGGSKSIQSKAERLEENKRAAEQRKLYKEGNLIHRTEAEVKSHTSYLVFAILPREWTEQDEQDCTVQYA